MDRLPESVEKDLERTKNREFEKNGGGILNLETGNRSDSTPTSSRQTFIATGPTGSINGVGYSTFINVSIYQYMLNAAARSYTNQNVDRIGGNFLGLREYCRETKIILIVSHDYEFLMTSCNKVLYLDGQSFKEFSVENDKEKILEILRSEVKSYV